VKIALLTTGVRGPGTYTLNLAHALERKGHTVLLVSLSTWRKERTAHMVEVPAPLAFGLVPIILSLRTVLPALREFAPDIIHHQWPSGSSDWFFGQVLALGVPTVATIHVSIDSWSNFFDRVFAWQFGRFRRHLPGLRGLISISRFVETEVEKRAKGLGGPHEVVYAGVDEAVFAPRERPPGDELRLLFVGQIMPEKGVDALVSAAVIARRSRPITLTIVGEGHLKAALQARTRGMSWVHWAGFLGTQAQIADHYALADLTVLPTRWDEAFSLVPVESMACGTPVLSTARGGNPEIVIPGSTGYLIPACKVSLLADVLRTARREDLEAMRPRCRQLALDRHTLGAWAEAHERIYRRALADAAARPPLSRGT
jgi:glycosyltransferase involved in cell wall biosynthesis